MTDLKNRKSILFLGTILYSLPIGFIFASIYTTMQNGFNIGLLLKLDLFIFWKEMPFVAGYASNTFYTGLIIMGVCSGLCLAIVFYLIFDKFPQHQGTADWGSFAKMAALGYIKKYYKITTPIFGKTSTPKARGNYLTNADQPHSLVVAPTRAGKGVGVVIPTLLTFDGSVLALDVKGELFEMTSRSRKSRGDKVIKFSPLDREGLTHAYNPVLDIVAAPVERRFMETRRLASNLIVAKGKSGEGFIDGARDLFVAGVLACIERGTPTIGAVYDLFALPGEKYKLFAQLAEESNVPEVKRIFNNMASNDTKIITSYTSVLGDGGLNLWADQLIKNATAKSDFSIYDLRRDPTSVFIVVSPNDLEVIAPLVRLFFQQIVSILQRDMPAKDEVFEVLFLLDEFKHLGKLEAIETAITTIAGYKGRFMFIIQSLAALTANYEQHGKENFLGNTGVQVFMATADDETPQYISKAIGEYTYKSKSKSYQRQKWFDINIQETHQGAPLMRPEQIRLLDDDTQIVLIKGHPPLKMPKVKFYADRILKPLFENQHGPLPEPEPIIAEPKIPLVIEPAPQEQANAPSAEAHNGEAVNELNTQTSAPPEATPEQEYETYESNLQDEDLSLMQQEEWSPQAEPDPPEAEPELTPAKQRQQDLLKKIMALQEQTNAHPSRENAHNV